MAGSRLLVLFATFLMVWATSPTAQSLDCRAGFYLNPNAQCVEETLALLSKMRGQNPTADAYFAFLGEAFRTYPDIKKRVLNSNLDEPTKRLVITSMRIAGLSSETATKADPNAALDNISPSDNPSANDTLISAFMASGDTKHIKRILANFDSADSATIRDAIRFALMRGKFGNGPIQLGPGRTRDWQTPMSTNACARYDCKTNPQKMIRMLILSSAFWALESLSMRDKKIQETFKEFSNENRMKPLILAEQAEFQNYMVMMFVYAGVQNNPKINDALAAFEQLNPM